MSQTRRRAAQQRPGRESAHSLGSILSRVYAVAASPPRPLPPPLQPPQQARLSPRIAAASQRPKGRPTLRRSTAGAASAGAAVVAAAAAAAAAACSPTAAGRGDRTHRSGHWAMVNRFRYVVLFFQNRARIVVRGLNMFARRHTPGATLLVGAVRSEASRACGQGGGSTTTALRRAWRESSSRTHMSSHHPPALSTPSCSTAPSHLVQVSRGRAAASPPMRMATESPPPPPVQTSPPVGRGLAASRPTGTALGAALAPLRVGCAVAPATLPGVEARGVMLRRDASRRQQSGRCVQLNQEHGEDTARFEEHSGRVE
jgi:hypothetical protein